MLKDLVKLANTLDSKGHHGDADRLDGLITMAAEQSFEDDEDVVRQGEEGQSVRMDKGKDEGSDSLPPVGMPSPNVTQINQQSVNLGGGMGSYNPEAGNITEVIPATAPSGAPAPSGRASTIYLEPYIDSTNKVIYFMVNIQAYEDAYIGDIGKVPYGPGALEEDGEAIDRVRFSDVEYPKQYKHYEIKC